MNYIVYLTWGPSPRYFETREEALVHYRMLRAALKNPDDVVIKQLTEI